MEPVILWDIFHKPVKAYIKNGYPNIYVKELRKAPLIPNVLCKMIDTKRGNFMWIKGNETQTNPESGPSKFINMGELGFKRCWFVDGKLHRNPEEGPAMSSNNNLNQEFWFNNRLHRPESLGPAVLNFDKGTGNSIYVYKEKGKNHRLNGPAVIWKDASGRKIKQEWWIRGIYHSCSS